MGVILTVRWEHLATYLTLEEVFSAVKHSRYSPEEFAVGARRGRAFTWYVLYQRQLCL